MTSLFQRIRRQWNNPQSNHRRIAISLLTIGSFVMLGKLAGAGKEVALAWRYGVSERLDAYVFVFTLITLPTAIWFSALILTQVPLVARAKQQDPSALQRFQREILGLSIVLSLALAGLVYLGLHWLLSQGWTGLTAPVLLHAQSLLGPLSVLLPLGFLISLLSAWLMARSFHRNTLLEAFPSLVLLLCLLAPQAWVPAPLIWGTLIGFVVQCSATLPVTGARHRW